MNILSKIMFFFFAAIILVVGYFVGFVILLFVFFLIFLMSVLFGISWILNNILNLSYNKTIKFFIKLFLSILVSIGFLALFTFILKNFLLARSLSFQIIFVWVFNIIVFTLSYTMLKSRSTQIQIQKDVFLLNQDKKPSKIITIIDLIIMVVVPALLSFGYYVYFFV